jgi:uncharacterized protein with PhoU and TrkA domain
VALGIVYGFIFNGGYRYTPFIGSSLSEIKLTERELLVLGIERGKNWVPIPKAKEAIQEGDRIVVYGPLDVLRDTFREECRKKDVQTNSHDR